MHFVYFAHVSKWLLFVSVVLFMAACGGSGQSDESSLDSLPGRIVFFGDSLTSGYRLTSDQAYPARIQSRIDSSGLNYVVENAGVVGDTSADGFKRIESVLALPIDIFVLALGVNDAEDALSSDVVANNLQAIINSVRASSPDAHIIVVGVRSPALMTDEQLETYATMYEQLATHNNAAFVPDMLASVATNPELILADGIHPNSSGHEIVAENIWSALAGLLR